MFEFKDRQWVCSESAYFALLAQGYVTHSMEKFYGRVWRLMVLA